MDDVVKKQSNVPGWHLVKLDENAFKALKKKRDQMKARGYHASYSDAVRELLEHEDVNAERMKRDDKLFKSERPRIPRIK